MEVQGEYGLGVDGVKAIARIRDMSRLVRDEESRTPLSPRNR